MNDALDIIKYNDALFLETISNEPSYLENPFVVERFLKVDVPKLVSYIRQMPSLTAKKMLNNEEVIMKSDDAIFKIIYLNLKDNMKENMIDNSAYLKKLLMTKPNSYKANLFDLSDAQLQARMLNHKNIIDEIDLNMYIDLILRLKANNFDEVTVQLDPKNFIKDDVELIQVLNDCYKLNEQREDIREFILNNFKRDRHLVYYLPKIKNFEELFIFTKFNVLLNLEIDYNTADADNKIKLDCGNTISFNYLKNINKKHVNLIINQLKANNPNEEESKIFVTSIKLYSLFGYDNAKKILDNKFTYMTQKAIERTALVLHIDNRRKYRLEHQDRFYSHGMVRQTIEALNNNDIEYFEYILGIHKEKAPKLMDDIQNHLDRENCYELTTEYLQEAIDDREEDYQKNFIVRFVKAYELQNPHIRSNVSCDELYRIFGNFDITGIDINEHGMPKLNEALLKFLLGNFKHDNDCLLRLVLNRCAYGLNETLDLVIQDFEAIKHIAETSGDKLSINSILDVIDISKVFLYNMAPNEQDLTLESIAKILRVDKYCAEAKEEIFLRARGLHAERKYKICSSIPIVAKKETDGVLCKTYKYDDPALIVTGIDTDSCLKVGGKGEALLRYCMVGPHALIVKLQDEKNNVYICPFIRNGNGLYGNGIDPAPKDIETSNKLMKSLSVYVDEFIKLSDKEEPIEFVTITDLHQEKFLANKNMKEIKIKNNLFIDAECYSDILKDNIKTYVIAEASHEYEPKFYTPEKRYYEVRRNNYIYHADKEKDNNFINITINSIHYNALDYRTNITDKERNSLKRSYKNLKVDYFEYIIGNKDWFVAIDKNMSIVADILPFDKRARGEYIEALSKIEAEYNLCKEGMKVK